MLIKDMAIDKPSQTHNGRRSEAQDAEAKQWEQGNLTLIRGTQESEAKQCRLDKENTGV